MTEISNVRIEDKKFPIKDTKAREDISLIKTEVADSIRDLKKEVADSITYLPLSKYKDMFVGNDITFALRHAIDVCEDGTVIVLNANEEYVISDSGISSSVIFDLNKPIKIDFNNSSINLKVNNKIVFDLTQTGTFDFINRVDLKNYFFKTADGFSPISIIRVNDAINSTLTGSMAGCSVTHSLIHNYKGYGTRIKGEMRYNRGGCAIYLSHSNHSIHSFDFDIDVDITGHTGTGIISEGGAGRISGVIESCSEGGYNYNGLSISHGVTLSCHFEANKMYDMRIGSGIDPLGGTRNTGITNIIGSYFSPSLAPEKSIIFGKTQVINIMGSWLSKPLKPHETSYSDTSITAFGNFQSFSELEDKYVGINNVNLSSFNAKNTKLFNVASESIKTKLLEVGSQIRGNGFVTDGDLVFTNSNADREIRIKEDVVLVPDRVYELGAKWNRFNNIHTDGVVLTSPDGSWWRMTVHDSGQPSFNKI